jgi:hypothetical protein
MVTPAARPRCRRKRPAPSRRVLPSKRCPRNSKAVYTLSRRYMGRNTAQTTMRASGIPK